MTNKELFDIETMRYFIPPNAQRTRITKLDMQAMVDLSSRGVMSTRKTKGFTNLVWGKTYRDLMITEWIQDIKDGIITKYEIYQSLPKHLRPWAESKFKNVPYDIASYEVTESGNIIHHVTLTNRLLTKGFHDV